VEGAESIEVQILSAAQRLIDRGHWRQNGMPTATDTVRAEGLHFGHLPEDGYERQAFQAVVWAIRDGAGNAWTDPEPLLLIVQQHRDAANAT
jgi:hypothetical protein